MPSEGFEQKYPAASLKQLSETQRQVLVAYYGLAGEPVTLKQIGEGLGVTAERVRQIRVTAEQRLDQGGNASGGQSG